MKRLLCGVASLLVAVNVVGVIALGYDDDEPLDVDRDFYTETEEPPEMTLITGGLFDETLPDIIQASSNSGVTYSMNWVSYGSYGFTVQMTVTNNSGRNIMNIVGEFELSSSNAVLVSTNGCYVSFYNPYRADMVRGTTLPNGQQVSFSFTINNTGGICVYYAVQFADNGEWLNLYGNGWSDQQTTATTTSSATTTETTTELTTTTSETDETTTTTAGTNFDIDAFNSMVALLISQNDDFHGSMMSESGELKAKSDVMSTLLTYLFWLGVVLMACKLIHFVVFKVFFGDLSS